MAEGEVATWVVLAGVLGGIAGAGVVALIVLVVNWRTDSAGRRNRHQEIISRWLAARLTATRSAKSVVAAFRSLSLVKPVSSDHSLRVEEMQRARADWCDAMRELDRAESEMIVLGLDDSIGLAKVMSDRISVDALRVAIHGSPQDVSALHEALEKSDEEVRAHVKLVISSKRFFEGGFGSIRKLGVLCWPFARLIDRWASPPEER